MTNIQGIIKIVTNTNNNLTCVGDGTLTESKNGKNSFIKNSKTHNFPQQEARNWHALLFNKNVYR
jgi:hypothetical protein